MNISVFLTAIIIGNYHYLYAFHKIPIGNLYELAKFQNPVWVSYVWRQPFLRKISHYQKARILTVSFVVFGCIKWAKPSCWRQFHCSVYRSFKPQEVLQQQDRGQEKLVSGNGSHCCLETN
jgi:hypothetical protein